MFAVCSTTVGWYASFFFAGGFISLWLTLNERISDLSLCTYQCQARGGGGGLGIGWGF